MVAVFPLLLITLFGVGFGMVGAIQLIAALVGMLVIWRRSARAIAGVWRVTDGQWSLERADGSTVRVRGPLSRVALSDGTQGGATGRLTLVDGTNEGPYRSSASVAVLSVRGLKDVYIGDVPFADERAAVNALAARGGKRLAIGVGILAVVFAGSILLVRAFVPVGCN